MTITNNFIDDLISICDSGRVLIDPAECWVYGNDNSRKHAPPDIVIFPKSHNEVVNIVKLCADNSIPITPRGLGSGTTGGATAPYGGVMISFEKMNQVIDFNLIDRTLHAQVGITNEAIQKYCLPHKMFWPPDPGSAAYCTLGGNIACNAAGPHALKYGTTRENILQIKVVSGDGNSLVCGALTSKSVVGFDLARLIIGSEGSLAIITEAVLKLRVLPEHSTSLCLEYSSTESAIDAVCMINQQSQSPCALEFMDSVCVELLKKNSDQNIAEETKAILLIEVDGSKPEIDSTLQTIKNVSNNSYVTKFRVVDSRDDAQHIWQIRKSLSPVLRNYKPHKINEDVVVPLSRLVDFMNGVKEITKEYDVCIANFGHIGNGNLHTNILYDDQQASVAQSALNALFKLVISINGSISGEHGIGLSKLNYVNLEIDQPTLMKMQQVKKIFDPYNILNRGKTLPM